MSAVEIRGGLKYFGSYKDPKVVLDRIDMTVGYGGIYGLLGPSGAGKTILLSCIVGIKKLNEGTIKVLGGTPGTKESGVPGKKVGFMPQTISLIEHFSIKEIIYYFGNLFEMNKDKIESRFQILKKVLELPMEDKWIGQLSGGQQRCVSFATSILHEPELLILDEPTVGLDPLLRENLWNFLVSQSSHSAIIITTHYIEEARKADRIGIMRKGKLLAEDSPSNILSSLGVDTIEKSFLLLCERYEGSKERNTLPWTHHNYKSKIDCIRISNYDPAHSLDYKKINPMKKSVEIVKQKKTRKMKALLGKNILSLLRRPAGLFFNFCFPILQLICFYLAVGGDPFGFEIGIVSEELTNYKECYNSSLKTAIPYNFSCDLHKVSCRFIDQIDEKVFIKRYYNNFEEGFEDAVKGKLIGLIHFASNFSESLMDVRDNLGEADEGSIKNREIEIFLDNTNQQTNLFLKKNLINTYLTYSRTLFEDCQFSTKLANVPVQLENPIYGSMDDQYTKYIVPSFVVTVLFLLSTLSASTIFIIDRVEGVWDRTLVAGASAEEMLLGHFLVNSMILLIQCTEIITISAVLFDVQNNGNNLTVIVLLILQAYSGMFCGFAISIYSGKIRTATFVINGIYILIFLLCGIVWPIEGMPLFLRRIAYFLPFTYPSIALRNILFKGFSISHPSVYFAFGTTLSWILIFLVISLIGLKLKK